MSKGLFWSDPNDEISILEKKDESIKGYGERSGSDIIHLKPEHIQALQDGKMLAWNDSEYSTFVVLDNPNEKPA